VFPGTALATAQKRRTSAIIKNITSPRYASIDPSRRVGAGPGRVGDAVEGKPETPGETSELIDNASNQSIPTRGWGRRRAAVMTGR
jgi:hypothetical protein